jgi:hypothetical protein
MKTFTAIIRGNHEKKNGNPLPKIKKTHYQHWTPAAKRYQAWKDYVLLEFLRQTGIVTLWDRERNRPGRPIQTERPGRAAHLHVEIAWGNNAHADPENAAGAIADSIVENDKRLNISALAWEPSDRGHGGTAETRITLTQAETDDEENPVSLFLEAIRQAQRTRPVVERAVDGTKKKKLEACPTRTAPHRERPHKHER